MTTKDEALRMAITALEYYELNDLHWDNADKAAIAACREALAQKDEQEPVAYVHLPGVAFNGQVKPIVSFDKHDDEQGTTYACRIPLYTAPPKRELLTEKEICDAWGYATGYEIEHGDSTECRTMHVSTDAVMEFARIVEGSIGVEE